MNNINITNPNNNQVNHSITKFKIKQNNINNKSQDYSKEMQNIKSENDSKKNQGRF